MLKLTHQDIENLNSKSNAILAKWDSTICQLLELSNIETAEKLWIAYRVLDDKILRLFAVDCARRALSRVSNPDPRSIAACDVAEKYARGEATDLELNEAHKFAYAAYVNIIDIDDLFYDTAAADAAYSAVSTCSCDDNSTCLPGTTTTAATAAHSAAAHSAATVTDADTERKLQITRLICIIKEIEKTEELA